MRKPAVGLLILAGFAAFCGGPFWWMRQSLASLDYRCNDHPPNETFTRYFGPVPAGVWDLRATGYRSIGGAAVWMRFRATRDVLPSLTRGYKKLAPKEAREAARSLTEEGTVSQPEKEPPGLPEEHRVHWEEIRKISSPEVYEKPQEYAGSDDTLVLDRSRRLVYFFHWNQ
jgi:hypothetical protein